MLVSRKGCLSFRLPFLNDERDSGAFIRKLHSDNEGIDYQSI